MMMIEMIGKNGVELKRANEREKEKRINWSSKEEGIKLKAVAGEGRTKG
jgi:hypothetical protein